MNGQDFQEPIGETVPARPKKPREHNEVLARSQVLYEKLGGLCVKQPKKLTRNQKELLAKKNMNPKNYMYVAEDDHELVVVSKGTNAIKKIAK